MACKQFPLLRWVVPLAVCALTAGCLPAIYRGHMTRAADAWSIEVRMISDLIGSVQLTGEPTYAVPPDGYRWIWVFMNVRNTAAAPRTFGYDSCELPLDGATVLPSFAGSVMSLFEDRKETYRPGEESYRRVIFAYPKGRYPATFRCGNMLFEIPRS